MSYPTTTLKLMGGLGLFALVSYGFGVVLGTSPCPLKNLTGLPCPGCGATTAGLALLQGDLAAAWIANGLFTLAYLSLPLLLLFLLVQERRGRPVGRWLTSPPLLYSIMAVLLLWGILRVAL